MKDFLIDENGDIVITKQGGNTVSQRGRQIQIVEGNKLIAQKILIALGTLKGEWFWNDETGIDFDYIIGKNITEDMIKSQIQVGINQVDESFYLSEFKVEFDKVQRTASINFTVASNGENIVKIEKVHGVEQGVDLETKLSAANTKITVYETSLKKLADRLTGN